ncbi:MAG: hypothetical protein WB660_06775 [Candidatus Sulfotelmatobacter sp.]
MKAVPGTELRVDRTGLALAPSAFSHAKNLRQNDYLPPSLLCATASNYNGTEPLNA